MSGPIVLFAGPSLAGGPDGAVHVPPDVHLRPPAARGDLARLGEGEEPGVVLLADGRFHDVPPPGHGEIRTLCLAGWQVWGVSSLGAIRAAECHPVGMRGFGRVYAALLADESLGDDEVTLLHLPESPWTALSEPLVHLRVLLTAEVEAGRLPPGPVTRVLTTLRSTWFGERTIDLVATQLSHALAIPASTLRQGLRERLPASRVKTLDLADLLRARPWETPIS
jgi:hypothetical protein